MSDIRTRLVDALREKYGGMEFVDELGFDGLPFAMQMRVAARVMDAVNQRYRTEFPRMGCTENEPISPSSMRYLAELWERAACVGCGEVNGDGCTSGKCCVT